MRLYQDDSILGYSAVWSRWSSVMFQSWWYWRQCWSSVAKISCVPPNLNGFKITYCLFSFWFITFLARFQLSLFVLHLCTSRYCCPMHHQSYWNLEDGFCTVPRESLSSLSIMTGRWLCSAYSVGHVFCHDFMSVTLLGMCSVPWQYLLHEDLLSFMISLL
jgi:hypothetical protein